MIIQYQYSIRIYVQLSYPLQFQKPNFIILYQIQNTMNKYQGFFYEENAFEYQLHEHTQQSKIYRLLPEAKKLLQKKIPLTDVPRVINHYVLYKLPPKLEYSHTITKPYFLHSTFNKENYQYHRYQSEQTLQQRYSNRQKELIYNKYPEKLQNPNPYKHQYFSQKFISIKQLLHLQPHDCHELQQKDYTERELFNKQYYQKNIFESRFQAGNLYKAYRIKQYQFDLILQNDTNTKGYNQWYYFFVTNIPKGTVVRFNIVNMINPTSLHKIGLQPAVMSLKRYKNMNKTWYRSGFDIKYEKSNLKRSGQENLYYSVMSFSYLFDYFQDIVFFAANFPYTYSKLLRQIDIWQNNLKIQKNTLCITPSQNYCYQLTLGNPKKPIIIIIARQHPGETSSNYLLQGIMKYFIEQSSILDNFYFKIIPMLNVDGCIYGNFRTNLIGIDMNRKWTDPDKYFTPEIFALKSLIKQLNKSSNIQYFIDLHGHSRELGAFIYSSSKTKFSKALPYYLNEYNQSFNKKGCTFGIQKSKETTARATIHYLIEGCESLTIETSIYGYKKQNEIIDFYPENLIKLGADIIKSLKISQKFYIDFKLQNFNDSGSEQDPTKDYIQEIQKNVQQICEQYKLKSLKPKRYRTISREKVKSEMKIKKKLGFSSSNKNTHDKTILTKLNSQLFFKTEHQMTLTNTTPIINRNSNDKFRMDFLYKKNNNTPQQTLDCNKLKSQILFRQTIQPRIKTVKHKNIQSLKLKLSNLVKANQKRL